MDYSGSMISRSENYDVADTKVHNSSLMKFKEVTTSEMPSRSSNVIFLLLCLIPSISTILYGGVDSGTWIIILALIGVVALSWVVDSWQRNGLLINLNFLLIPLSGLVAIGLIQLLPLFPSGNSDTLFNRQSVQPISMDPYATRLFVIRLVVYFVFLAAATTFLNSVSRLRTLTLWIIFFTAMISFFGILQWLAKPEAIYGLRETPNAISFGPFVNQHHFAAFSVLGCGLAVGMLTDRSGKHDKIFLLIVAALMMAVGAILTGSRGGFLGFTGMLAFVLIFRFWIIPKNSVNAKHFLTRILAMTGMLGAALIIIFCVIVFVGGDTSLLRSTGLGITSAEISNGRLHFWSIAIKIFFQHPLLGVGYDAFGVVFTQYDTWNGVFRVEQAHNDYLQTLSDAGAAGFVCVVSFIFFLFRKGFSIIRSVNDPTRTSITIGALAGCFGILIHSFFDFPLRTPSNAFFFLLLGALATANISPKAS